MKLLLCKIGVVGAAVLIFISLGNIFGQDKSEIKPLHKMHFYEQTLFLKALALLPTPSPFSYKLRGGIIPHHLLPSDMIARFFQKISLQNPKTIILIGPNHYERGLSKVLISDRGWETPFGVLQPDEAVIDKLTSQKKVDIDYEVVEYEHSVAGIMPFIKHFIPQAKVVPLVLKSAVILDELSYLAESIKNIMAPDTIIIAPVDFSHYLTSSEAQRNDKITWEAIKNYDFRRIKLMNNDYLDSPASIILTMILMQKLGSTQIALFENTNSGVIMGDLYAPTTSYFSIGFY